jgi:hypothetical protein
MLGSEKDLFLRYCYLYDLDFFNFLINKLECRNLNKKILYIFGENVLYNTDFTLKRRRLENLKQLSILKKCYNEAILRTDLNIFEYIKYYKLLKIQLFFGDED